ncbi:MAG TPA: hypothetical protein DDY13_08720 [Cytophagales bacterium]|nr:hypothetical protein [Cytophagales bacterium]
MGIFSGCAAQILPVEEQSNYIYSGTALPESINYIKDVNGLFDRYEGTWQINYDGFLYTFFVEKITKPVDQFPARDLLLMRYKIENDEGNILDDTSDLPDEHKLVIRGRYFLKGAHAYELSYLGELSACGQNAHVIISPLQNQLKFYFRPKNDTAEPGCMNDVSFPFPIETALILTKVN